MKGCRVLSGDEISKLLVVLGPRDKMLALICLNYGLRVSEALELCFGQFQTKENFISIQSKKNSENVTFPKTEEIRIQIAVLILEYSRQGVTVSDDTPLFLNKNGVGMTRQAASEAIRAGCRAAGLSGKVNSHSFRKSFVTKVYEMSGKDIALTKKYSRHKSLANLDYYIGTSNELTFVRDLNWTKADKTENN